MWCLGLNALMIRATILEKKKTSQNNAVGVISKTRKIETVDRRSLGMQALNVYNYLWSYGSFIRCGNYIVNLFVFHAIWARLHPDFNTHACGHWSYGSFIRCGNYIVNLFVFHAIWARLHPDFNTHACGHCVNFSGKKVTAPPRPKVLVLLCV